MDEIHHIIYHLIYEYDIHLYDGGDELPTHSKICINPPNMINIVQSWSGKSMDQVQHQEQDRLCRTHAKISEMLTDNCIFGDSDSQE